MEKISGFLEKFLAPIGQRLATNKPLTIIRQSMMGLLPLTIAGSISLIIQYFPFIDKIISAEVMAQITDFLGMMSNATLSLVGLYLAGLIGYFYAKQEDNEGIYGAIVSISSFLILTPFTADENFNSFIPMQWLGGQGLFVAMFVGLLSGFIFNKLMASKATIKLPDSVPPMVSEPFKMLVPSLITFTIFCTIRYIFTFTSYGNIHAAIFTLLQQPLLSLGTTLPASIIVVVIIQLLWFLGLHGQNIVGAVMLPIWMSATVSNLTAVTNGEAPTYIFTNQFFSAFVWMQFFSLIIACLIGAKSAQLKSVGKLSVGAAVFNISEPIVFGAPVVTNVMLFIPWILVMVIYVLITWIFMKTGMCPLPTGADIPWTTPPLLSGYLSTGSIMGAVVQLINLAVGTLVYLPFVKIYDKQLLKQESEREEGNEVA